MTGYQRFKHAVKCGHCPNGRPWAQGGRTRLFLHERPDLVPIGNYAQTMFLATLMASMFSRRKVA